MGAGQVRTAKQLPVLTMVCAYSRWLLAMLLPSRHAQDLFAGWWRLIHGLGAECLNVVIRFSRRGRLRNEQRSRLASAGS